MSHNPFLCLWNRLILPFFVKKAYSQGLKPTFNELDSDEKEILLEYIYDKHNLDDFHSWLQQHHFHHKECSSGAKLWNLRLTDGKHELVCMPDFGPLFYFFMAFIYVAFALFLATLVYAVFLGLQQIFLN